MDLDDGDLPRAWAVASSDPPGDRPGGHRSYGTVGGVFGGWKMGRVRSWEARRSPRLVGYDYRQAGAYFVTVCTWGREPLLGEVVGGEMQLDAAGHAVQRAWETLPRRFPGVDLDAFVVMPNHVHGVLVLGGDPSLPPSIPTPSLSAVLRAFKSVAAIEGHRALDRAGQAFWQRSYHDHIIRNNRALEQIRRYIVDNPACWDTDAENPSAPPTPHDPDPW